MGIFSGVRIFTVKWFLPRVILYALHLLLLQLRFVTMRASQLLETLSHHRNQRSPLSTLTDTLELSNTNKSISYSGKYVAKPFTNKASSSLMKAEYNLLLIFLKKGANTGPATQDAQQNLQERVENYSNFLTMTT